MKKLEFKLTLEVSDSASTEDWISDIEDMCCADCCKSVVIETEGKKVTFDNVDFEEDEDD